MLWARGERDRFYESPVARALSAKALMEAQDDEDDLSCWEDDGLENDGVDIFDAPVRVHA